MTDRMRVIVEGQDNASDEFRRIGQNAQTMGRDIDRASDVAERGFRGVGQAATRMERDVDRAESGMQRFSRTGAALGAVVGSVAGVLSEFARAAAEEEATFSRLEAAVDATGQSFDELEPAIAAAIAGAEDLSFADDQAAEALTRLTATTGSAEEAMSLLALTMDVARGRNISLATAADLVGKVAAGNTGILARYGIVIAEGATATEALASLQQRYAGQSEAYAATTQGGIDRLKNSFDNWAESVGASTGEVQTLLTLLPGLSAGFSGVSAVVGGLVGVMGPAGLALAALAAATAIGVLILSQQDNEVATVNADEATESLIDALNRLAQQAGGTATESFLLLSSLQAQLTAILELQNAYEAGEIKVAAYDAAVRRAKEAGEDEEAQAEAGWRAYRLAEEALAAYVITLEDGITISNLMASTLQYQGDQWVAVSAHVTEAWADFERGRIDVDGLIRRLEQIPQVALDAAGATDELAGANERLARATEEAARAAADLQAAWQSQPIDAEAAFVAATADAVDRLTRNNLAQIASTRDVVQAQRDAEAAFLAAAEASREEAVSLDDAALAMGSIGYASFAALDGLVTLTEQERLLTVQGAELAAQQSAVSTQLGFYRGAVNDMEAAYEELQARQAAGETLNASDIAFMREFEAEAAGLDRTIGDLVIEQGKLAQAQIDNAEASEGLTDSIEGLVEPLTIIAEALAEIAGIDIGDLSPPERTAVAWTELAMGVSAARDALAGVVPSQPATSAGGEGTGGPYPQGQGAASGGGATEVTMRVTVEAAAAFAELTAVQERAEFVMDGPAADGWTMEVRADGEQAFALIRDVDGDVVRLVTADYTVVIDGDGLSAKEEISAVSMALANLDGSHATVYADADTSAARAEINSLLGFQGRGYVIIDGIGGQRVGPTDLTLASGGVVPAASGRVVRAGEIGPELVYPPGGSPYLAARDGLYVMQPGRYVSNAPATRAATQRSRPTVINIGPIYATDGRDAGRQIAASLRGIL
jgi:hypothetical protein